MDPWLVHGHIRSKAPSPSICKVRYASGWYVGTETHTPCLEADRHLGAESDCLSHFSATPLLRPPQPPFVPPYHRGAMESKLCGEVEVGGFLSWLLCPAGK